MEFGRRCRLYVNERCPYYRGVGNQRFDGSMCIPTNSHALGVILTPVSLKL